MTIAAQQRLRMDQMLEAVRGLDETPGTRRLIYNISRWPAEATATFLALIESARRGPYPAVGINDEPVLAMADRIEQEYDPLQVLGRAAPAETEGDRAT